jgi:Bacterial protein of unknown function (DUF937)
MNLVKIILDLLFSGDVLGKLSSLLGTDNESTKKATSAAVPALLSGLAGLAASDDGVRKLASTFNGLDPSSLGNLAKMLGGDTSAVTQKGTNLLSSLFGESLVSSIASSVGKFADLDTSMTKKLLGLIGPTVLSTVAGQWKEQGGGIGALTSLLTGQQKNIAAALPSGFSLASIPGLPSAEGTLRAAGQAARTAGGNAVYAAKRTADAAEDATWSLLKWLAPLAALLLLALGLWYFFGRRPDQVARNAADATTNAARATAKATGKAVTEAADAAGEAVTALRPELPAVPQIPDITIVNKDLSGIFTSATQALAGIRDAASAQAALPKLMELNGKIYGIRDQLDKLPAAGQAALGQLVGKQFGPLQEQVAKIREMPGVSDQVKSVLAGITNELAGLNLAQVSQDATNIFTTLTKTLNGFTDAASAEAALPQLQEVSGKLDELKRVQSSMSPGGQTMVAKLVSAARGTLDQLIAKVLAQFGVDAAAIKPVLDGIVDKLAGLEQPNQR